MTPRGGVLTAGAPESLTQSLAVVIPAFNEAKTIAEVAGRARKMAERVVVVDDGSTDGTLDCLTSLDVESRRHDRNLGKGEGILTGAEVAREAGCALVVTLDADGQHPPETIPDLVACAEPRHIVIGARQADADHVPRARYWANQTANFFVSWAAGHWIPDTQCGFRVYPVELFAEVELSHRGGSGFVLESEVLVEACRAGYRVKTVAIPALYDSVLQRPSRYRPLHDSFAIGRMLASKLLKHWFFLSGLRRALKERSAAKP